VRISSTFQPLPSSLCRLKRISSTPNPSCVVPGLPGEAVLENSQQCCPGAAEILIDLAPDVVSVVVALRVPTV
jgi:hypothetical protein